MKRKIVGYFLMALLFTVTVGSIVSCKDTDEDEHSKIWAELNSTSTIAEGVQAQIAELKTLLSTLQSTQASIQTDLDALRKQHDQDVAGLDGRISTAEASLEIIEKGIRDINVALGNADDPNKSLAEIFDELTATIATLKGQLEAVADLQSRVTANEEQIADLWEAINSIESIPSGWSDRLNAIADSVSQALALAQADSARIDALEGDVADLMTYVGDVLKDAEGNWMSLEEYIALQREAILAEIRGEGGEGLTLAGLKSAYEKADSLLQDQIDVLSGKVRALELYTNELNSRLGLVESILNSYITGIVIQGTYNQVFGTFSMPLNVNSRVLAAYYGTLEKTLRFPTTRPSDFAKGVCTGMDATDLAMLKLSEDAVVRNEGRIVAGDGVEGNAGTLYLSINPTNLDATSLGVPSLENSLGEASGVELSSLRNSDAKLSFGYTRGAAGFYETSATIPVEAIDDVKPRITYDDLTGFASTVKNEVSSAIKGNGVNISSIVSQLYTLSSDVLDATGVKFSWSDASGVQRGVVSDYSLAATAIKPFGYKTLQDVNVTVIPGKEAIENIIGRIFDKIEDMLPNVNVDDLNIHIEVEDFEFGDVTTGTIEANVTIEVTDPAGNPMDVYVEPIDITEEVNKAVNDALGQAGGQVSDYIKDMVKQLNEQVAQINDIIDELRTINEIGNSIADIEKTLIDYLNKANDKLASWINKANTFMQPVMFAGAKDDLVVLSQSKNAPTVFTGGNAIYLYASSYNVEILAPAYKKLVGVTNVYDAAGNSAKDGDATCVAALDAANGSDADLAKVIDGSTTEILLSSLEENLVYEILYTAVDYQGYVVAKKFYVTIR